MGVVKRVIDKQVERDIHVYSELGEGQVSLALRGRERDYVESRGRVDLLDEPLY